MFRKNRYYYGLAVWSAIYLIGILVAPLAPNRFNLSSSNTHLILLAIAIPLIIIWSVAIYGTVKLLEYSEKIKKYSDGAAYALIARGLLFLAVEIMAGGLSQVIRPYSIQHNWLAQWTVSINLIQALLTLIAFIWMYRGTSRLAKFSAKGSFRSYLFIIPVIITLVLAYIFIKAVYTYPYRTSTPDATLYSSYYLPDIAIFYNVILPYVSGWFLGLLSVFMLGNFTRKVNGKIYKSALRNLTVGIIVTIGSAVVVQILVAFTTYMAKASLGSVVGIIYGLLLLYAVGFIYLASGAKRLNAIEEAGDKK